MNNKLLVVLFAVVIVLMYGCTQTPATEPQETVSAEIPAEPAPTETAPEEPVQAEATGAKDVLKSLVGSKPDYLVKYTFSTISGGEELAGTQAHYIKGENFRTDSEISIDGQKMVSATYVLDSKLYTCSKTMGNWMCMEFPQMDGEDTSTFDPRATNEDFAEELDSWFVEELPDRTIAEETAKCFSTTMAEVASQETEVCYSSEGVPLYIGHVNPDGSYTLEAIEFSRTVSDSDFELPAEPEDFPIMGMGGEGMTEEELQAMAEQYS